LVSSYGNAALVLVAGTTVLIDQLAKALVSGWRFNGRFLTIGRGPGVPEPSGRGTRFLALSTRHALVLWIGAVAWLELMLGIGAQLSAIRTLGLGLALGGATGNLADRLARGSVIDFISVAKWSTFNLADAAMVCGIGLTAWSSI